MSGARRVVAVTGGGGGIGAAVAEAIGRTGAHVVTMDPLVSLDGAEQLPPPEETTAGRIIAAGGSAEATSVSVTDRPAVQALFDRLVAEHGALDGVVNVAGISRPTGFGRGTEEDWLAVLRVHLDGYLNILRAALPVMAAAGRGQVVGVTSGSGWRAANAGAYSCAKRAVAALTWQLGPVAPQGVAVNAMSPIAVTRMVTAALGAAAKAPQGPSSGGLSLATMPAPEEIGPLGAHLVDGSTAWCRGQIVFAGGSEAALVEPPQLLEVVGTAGAASLPHLLESVTPAWVAAEAQQATSGGSNPRFSGAFDERVGELAPPAISSCALLAERPDAAAATKAALEARGVRCTTEVEADTEAIVVLPAPMRAAGGSGWEQVLDDHDGLADVLVEDARWARVATEHAKAHARPVRLVLLVDATTAGGRSRAQAAAQLSRAALGATGQQVTCIALADEGAGAEGAAAVLAHLVCSADGSALSGAELVVGPGWCGLRSHPRPRGSITYGGPELPPWFDGALRGVVGS